ncbi:MAG: HNH endonuclease [Acidimicrobiia bacterium]
MFDVNDHLDELRRHTTKWLIARRDEVKREQRRLHVEELAIIAVLDEREALDDDLAARDGVSERTARKKRESARAMKSKPNLANAGHNGDLSEEQLDEAMQLADESTDEEWAERAQNMSPDDLARQRRAQSKPTADDAHRRRQARSLRMWWTPGTGMLSLRGELPDLDGARFEATINKMIEQMRPPKGHPWDSYEHRGADALMQLIRAQADAERPLPDGPESHEATRAHEPVLVVHVPLDGPAEVAGVPLPHTMVEQLRANSVIEPVLVDERGEPITVGRRGRALSPKIARAVLLRDGHCRVPGCERRRGLQIHHLVPRSWGGTDDISNLAAVCTGGPSDHHATLVPHGRWVLLGNPNQPDGLELVLRDELTEEEALTFGLPPPFRRTG